MQVSSVEISNFRSIKKQTIEFKSISGKTCSILLGINEGGKSNILKAINGYNTPLNYATDCNKEAKKRSEPIEIIYNFSFVKKAIKDKLIEVKYIDSNLYKILNVNIIQHIVRIDNSSKDSYFYIDVEDKPSFNDYLINPTKTSIIKMSNLSSGSIQITEDNYEALVPNYTRLNKSNLENFIENIIGDLFPIMKIIFWSSSNEYLINEPIDLNIFKDNYNLSIPLRNIFYISDINDIKERIELIVTDNEARDELADDLTENISKYISEVWPEHEIKLEIKIEESLKCRVNVIDIDNPKKRYIMGERSDGFKQFISILLNLSVENNKSKLKNHIILLDEPEVHLHPSGIKFLREELLQISKNNTVVFSTHSTYMVDRTALNRHYKISKSLGETTIFPIEDNPYKEEVIYESLGTSIYEHIKPNMLLFEGKTDKDIFDGFTEYFIEELKPIDIGSISADGVTNIEKYSKFFDGKMVKGFILVDSDKAGIGQKDKVIKTDNYSIKNVFDINSVHKTQNDATLEDLLPLDIILDQTNNLYDVTISESSIDNKKAVFEQINKELKNLRKIGNKEDFGKLKLNIITFILSDLKTLDKPEINKKYKKYITFLNKLHLALKK